MRYIAGFGLILAFSLGGYAQQKGTNAVTHELPSPAFRPNPAVPHIQFSYRVRQYPVSGNRHSAASNNVLVQRSGHIRSELWNRHCRRGLQKWSKIRAAAVGSSRTL